MAANFAGVQRRQYELDIPFELKIDHTITCTATNTLVKKALPTGTITIVKKSIGGDGDFTFTGDLIGSFISLKTQGGQASSNKITKNVGTYNVTEIVPAGWDLDSIACTGDAGPQIHDLREDSDH